MLHFNMHYLQRVSTFEIAVVVQTTTAQHATNVSHRFHQIRLTR